MHGPRILLQQFSTYSEPKRDPRGRVITTAFLAIAPNLPKAVGGTDAYRADWIEVESSLWADPNRLAFDHGLILKEALERARWLLEHTTVATGFCGKEFTISELRQVYEAVWNIRLNPQPCNHATMQLAIVRTLERRWPLPGSMGSSRHPSWCTLSNRLRIRNTRDDRWQWEVVSKSGKQLAKGPAHHSFGLASKTDWVPSLSECRECPDHPGVRLKLNLNMVPICAVPDCDYGP